MVFSAVTVLALFPTMSQVKTSLTHSLSFISIHFHYTLIRVAILLSMEKICILYPIAFIFNNVEIYCGGLNNGKFTIPYLNIFRVWSDLQ